MRVFQIVGVRRSGKTTTAGILIRNLKDRGYRVGAVKCIGCPLFSLDSDPNSGTSRLRNYGADVVVAFGSKEVDFMYPGMSDMDRTLGILSSECLDYCIIEGGYGYDLPRIVCFRNMSEVDERITEHTFAFSGAGAGECSAAGRYPYPVISALTDPAALTDLVEASVNPLSLPVKKIPRPESCRKFCGECTGHGNLSGRAKNLEL